MRVEKLLVISGLLGIAAGSLQCSSNGLPAASRDATAPDLAGGEGWDARSDATGLFSQDGSPDLGGSPRLDAVQFVIPPTDGAASPSQACLSPGVANCSVEEARYYFDTDAGKCVGTQGCKANANTFATAADCETACIRILNCSCTPGSAPCETQGLCGTCPSPNQLANATDTASGSACVNPGLICHVTTADALAWRCDCIAWSGSITWRCGSFVPQ